MGAVDERADRRRPAAASSRDPADLELAQARRDPGPVDPRDPAMLVDGALGVRPGVARSLMSSTGMPETIDALLRLRGRRRDRLAARARRRAPRAGGSARSTSPNERSLHVDPDPEARRASRSWSRSARRGRSVLPWDEQTRAILIGAVVIAAVGVIDDVFDLPPLLKLLGQIGAAIDPGLHRSHRRRLHAAVRRRRRPRRPSSSRCRCSARRPRRARAPSSGSSR